MNTLGERLKAARLEAGVSLAAAGKQVKKSRQAVANWEKDKDEPRLVDIGILAAYYRIDPVFLVFGSRNGGAQPMVRPRDSILADLDELDRASIRSLREIIAKSPTAKDAVIRLRRIEAQAAAIRQELRR